MARYDKATGRLRSEATVSAAAGLDHGVAGLARSMSDAVVLDVADGMLDTSSPQATLRAKDTAMGSFSVDWPAEATRAARVHIGSRAFTIEVGNTLAGIRYSDARGNVLTLQVDELAQDVSGVIHVDRTLRRYTASGRQVGIARVDLGLYVANPVAVLPDGQLVAMSVTEDAARIEGVRFADSIDAVLPTEAMAANTQTTDVVAAACRARSTMVSVADGYRYNIMYLNDTNINGACTGRTKPRYLAYPA